MSCGYAGLSVIGNVVFDAMVSRLCCVLTKMACSEAKLVWVGRIVYCSWKWMHLSIGSEKGARGQRGAGKYLYSAEDSKIVTKL